MEITSRRARLSSSGWFMTLLPNASRRRSDSVIMQLTSWRVVTCWLISSRS